MAVSKLDVQKLYVAYFNRPADLAGLDYWTKSGATVAQIATSFSNVQEYKDAFAGKSNTEVVAQVYENLFARTADFDGLNYWVKLLNDKKITIADVVTTVYNGAVGSDKDILTNKVAAADLFTTAINTTEEAVAYSTAAANSAGRAYLNLVTADAATVTTAAATADAVLAKIISDALPPVVVPPPVPPTITTFTLTTGLDNLTGSPLNDTFNAVIVDNSNTFQSGDVINATGAGTDTLNAYIGNSQKFAIKAQTSGIETVKFTAQAVSTDSTDNNTAVANRVQIDAQLMQDVTRWESNNSRADVLVEDVRILDSQVTKDITIAMVSTDPGHVDYGVYFDQASLRAASSTTAGATLSLRMMDLKAAGLTPTTPLLDSPYDGFTFKLGGVTKTIRSTDIDKATTYNDLVTAISAALTKAQATDPSLAGLSVAKSGTFTAKDGDSGIERTGDLIVLTNSGAAQLSVDSTTGFTTALGVTPSNSNFYTFASTGTPTTANKLITSNIVLDDVGRGSTGGDLVVGGLSIGDTSTSIGVDRFEIHVDRNSKLQTINSTDNALKEVVIDNIGAKGNLVVLGDVTGAGYLSGDAKANIDAALPGTATQNGGVQHNAFGFSDVRLIDASAMAGKVTFSAEITASSIAKFNTNTTALSNDTPNPVLVDTNGNPVADNVSVAGTTIQAADFIYTGGANNDQMLVQIDPTVLASRSTAGAGREDMSIKLDGGAGDDIIVLRVSNQTGGAQNWYNNQDLNNNITVLGGAGNDTIRTLGAGDKVIDGGTGNDTIYADNTGSQTYVTTGAISLQGNANMVSNGNGIAGQAVSLAGMENLGGMGRWVFNTSNQTDALAISRNINDLRSDFNDSYNLANATVKVTFKGLSASATVSTVTNATGTYQTTDLTINQAIKAAINSDPVLSKLLVAQDGPANSLVVLSVIDGAMTTSDLSVSLAAPTTLSDADIKALNAAYPASIVFPTKDSVLATMTAEIARFNSAAYGDYVTALGNDGTVDTTGAASTSTSDNLITGGAGDDVIVLGTAVGTSAALSSNDTIAFSTGFGSDTIVNFNATGFGIDHLDLVGLLGANTKTAATFNGATLPSIDKSITVATVTTANNTEANIAKLFTDSAAATAKSFAYVAVDAATNVGSVYVVTDAAGGTAAAGNVTAVKAGSINLGSTLWSSLTAANFVNSAAVDYSLIEGPTGATPVAAVTPGAVASTVTVAAANVTANDATVGNVTYNITPLTSSFTYAINGFAAGDKLAFTAGTAISVVNTSGTDGNITVTGSLAGQTETIQLTGVALVSDAAIFGAISFNTAFGAGSLA